MKRSLVENNYEWKKRIQAEFEKEEDGAVEEWEL